MTLRTICLLSFAAFVATTPLASLTVHADIVGNTGTQTFAIHRPVADGGQGPIASGDYYGSGNDDNFGEYGLTTFNFGGSFAGTVTAINNVELTLTVNDRSFSDGDAVEVFFTTDTGADLDNGGGDFSALSFDQSLFNGINASQYTFAPVSLGVFSIPEMAGRAGGEMDTLTLNFGANVTALIDAINNGADFQILLGTTDATHDITYSGVGNTFDPGDPVLSIDAEVTAIPEPTSATIVGAVAVLGFSACRRRR